MSNGKRAELFYVEGFSWYEMNNWFNKGAERKADLRWFISVCRKGTLASSGVCGDGLLFLEELSEFSLGESGKICISFKCSMNAVNSTESAAIDRFLRLRWPLLVLKSVQSRPAANLSLT